MYTVETTKGKATHTVTFYDSPAILPYRRYHKFNKHMMIDMEVGSSIADYDKRSSRGVQYLQHENIKSAIAEFTNRRQCMHHILEEYSPKGMAGAVMVYSIDGVVYTDFQEPTLNSILDKLEEVGFTFEQLTKTIDHLKKK